MGLGIRLPGFGVQLCYALVKWAPSVLICMVGEPWSTKLRASIQKREYNKCLAWSVSIILSEWCIQEIFAIIILNEAHSWIRPPIWWGHVISALKAQPEAVELQNYHLPQPAWVPKKGVKLQTVSLDLPSEPVSLWECLSWWTSAILNITPLNITMLFLPRPIFLFPYRLGYSMYLLDIFSTKQTESLKFLIFKGRENLFTKSRNIEI